MSNNDPSTGPRTQAPSLLERYGHATDPTAVELHTAVRPVAGPNVVALAGFVEKRLAADALRLARGDRVQARDWLQAAIRAVDDIDLQSVNSDSGVPVTPAIGRNDHANA